MRQIQTLVTISALAVGAFAGVAPAAVVALYNGTGFSGSNSSGSFASADADASSTASGLTAGTGLLGLNPSSSAYDGFGTSTTGNGDTTGIVIRSYFTAADLDTAKSSGSSIGFSITPAAGNSLQLISLSFDLAITWNSSTTMNAGVVLNVGDTAYGSPATLSKTGSGTTAWSTFTLDLTQMAPITNSTALTLYIYDNVGSGGVVRFDNIKLEGDTLAVPEPASFGVLAASGMGLLMLRRKPIRA